MLNRMPPLNAVRAFVAAARHESFTRAAAELHVTHSAVSRQVKYLETYLGVALFERRVRQISLTVQGQQFFVKAQAALGQLADAAQALTQRAPSHAVRINVRPTFAVRWLIPRLPAFVAQYPGIEPQVVTSTRAPDQVEDTYDVAIRRGLEGWPTSMQIHPFIEDHALVVGAPSLFTDKPVSQPAHLARHTLLSSRTRERDWEDWKQRAGSPSLASQNHLHFDHLHFVLQAALDGLGFALGPVSLIAHDMASGRLMSPLPQWPIPLNRYYYGISAHAHADTQCFVAWLESELQGQIARGY